MVCSREAADAELRASTQKHDVKEEALQIHLFKTDLLLLKAFPWLYPGLHMNLLALNNRKVFWCSEVIYLPFVVLEG